MPMRDGLVFAAGDELLVQGPLPLIEDALPHIGYPERTSDETDMVTVGVAVAAGALVGVPAVTLSGVPLGLTTSVGALLIGLVIGWRRSKSPTWGLIPTGALWFFETVGLAAFIAVVGLTAGPAFVDGLRDYGVGLFLAGVVVTLVPLIVGTLAARYLFRFDPVLTLGMLAGAQTTTAAVGTLREAARSSVPLLGFTIPYAVGNIVLTIGGAVVVLFTAG
jgi:putative transport protein